MVRMCMLPTRVSGSAIRILKVAPQQHSIGSNLEVTRSVVQVIQIVRATQMATAHIVQEPLVVNSMELPRRLNFIR
jgi:hypothetical protein